VKRIRELSADFGAVGGSFRGGLSAGFNQQRGWCIPVSGTGTIVFPRSSLM